MKKALIAVLFALILAAVPAISAEQFTNPGDLVIQNTDATVHTYNLVWVGFPDNFPGEVYLAGADPLTIATAKVNPGEKHVFHVMPGVYRVDKR